GIGIAETLSQDDGGRLLFISGHVGARTIELAHEALVSQWPRYVSLLQSVASLKRIHDRVIDRARAWRAAKRKRPRRFLATGIDLEEGRLLLEQGPALLSPDERLLLEKSTMLFEAKRQAMRGGVALLIVALVSLSLDFVLPFLSDV